MGEFKAFLHGQAIVRQSEMGNEMFVLIGGKAEVQVTVNGHSRELNRGDVCGETDLLRHYQRAADLTSRLGTMGQSLRAL
jgi:CRP-like cAMP-binding protein